MNHQETRPTILLKTLIVFAVLTISTAILIPTLTIITTTGISSIYLAIGITLPFIATRNLLKK